LSTCLPAYPLTRLPAYPPTRLPAYPLTRQPAYVIHLSPHRSETPLQVVRERCRVIQSTGVQPHSMRAELPGGADCPGEQVFPPAPSDEPGRQPEVGDLDATLRVSLELEIAGGNAFPREHPQRHIGISQIARDRAVAPIEAIGPMVGPPDFAIQESEQCHAFTDPFQIRFRGWRGRRPELVGR